MNKIFTLTILAFLILAILGYFVLQKFGISDNTVNQDEGFKVAPLILDNQTIEFPYTDDNEDETMIIKSDKPTYEGFAESDVYFSLSNISDVEEDGILLFYFQDYSSQKGDPTGIDKPKLKDLVQITDSKTSDTKFFKDNISINSTKLSAALSKKKEIPEEFEVKGGAQIKVAAGQTAYFKAKISYPPGSDGEFWIETLGENGGYGLLDPWYSSNWSGRKMITIDHNKVSGTSNFTNFPVLINISSDPDLRGTAFFGKVASGAGEFVFTSSNGTTKLDHEIEKYTASSGELVAWVEVSTLDYDDNTILYLYYGGPTSGATNQNPTGVWDANYVGVWHLKENPAATCNGTKEVCDSTSGGNHGDMSGSMTSGDQVTGKIDGALDFDAVNDSIQIANESNFDFERTDPFSVSFWTKSTNTGDKVLIAKNDNSAPYTGWQISKNYDASSNTVVAGKLEFGLINDASTCNTNWLNINTDTQINSGVFHHYGITYDGSVTPGGIKIYEDGISLTTSTECNTLSATILNNMLPTFGSRNAEGIFYDGTLDEVRVSNIVRPADWIATEYNNQLSPQTFYTLSAETLIRAPSVKIAPKSYDSTLGWYSTGGTWNYREKIAIKKEKVAGSFTNFPVLITKTDTDLKHTSFGGKVASSSAGITGGGGDFVFTSSDGTTKLDHEIEKYASSSGELWAWVEIPTLNNSKDTAIYMYYGGPNSGATNQNPTGVWDTNYKGVWHMKETSGTTVKDSTSNAFDGTKKTATEPDPSSTSKINGGQNFDGTDDYVYTPDNTALHMNQATSMTFSAWIKADTLTSFRDIIRYDDLDNLDGDANGTRNLYLFRMNGSKIEFYYGPSSALSSVLPTYTFTTGYWYHVVATRNVSADTESVYIDGSLNLSETDTTTGTWETTGQYTIFGRFDNTTNQNYFDGIIDEIRISNSARSADWIKTEYLNQVDPSSFVVFYGEESRTNTGARVNIAPKSYDSTLGWYSTGGTWNYREKIAIKKEKVAGSLTNFPVLITKTDTDLKHTSFGGKVASASAGFTGGGGDFVFTSSDGTTKLDHEIEKYASSSGELLAWVEVPTLNATTDTTLYVYYGGPSSGATNQNKTGTWDANYKGVWHLPNGTTLGALDSTSNANNGTISGAVATAGQMDGAGDFDGTDDQVNAGSAVSLDDNAVFTSCAWINPDTVTGNHFIAAKGKNVAPFGKHLIQVATQIGVYSDYNTVDADAKGNVNVVVNQWQHVCGSIDSSNVGRVYYNGQEASSYSIQDTGTGGARTDASYSLRIGTRDNLELFFNGLIDEVRIYSGSLSADWIKTEYLNQVDPSSFVVFYGEESRTNTGAKIKIR